MSGGVDGTALTAEVFAEFLMNYGILWVVLQRELEDFFGFGGASLAGDDAGGSEEEIGDFREKRRGFEEDELGLGKVTEAAGLLSAVEPQFGRISERDRREGDVGREIFFEG